MSQFPNLLRRSSFATHDPLITRIYTSTPSSVSKYGDWGLKYPIHRKKGPRHIRFSQFDAGSAIGADWRSGEREARFMEQWGSGRVAWSRNTNGLPNTRQRPNFIMDPATQPEPERRRKMPVSAIESMSEKEFERYLDQVRAEKGQALERYFKRIEMESEEKAAKKGGDSVESQARKEEKAAAEKAAAEGRRAMVWLAMEGKLDKSHGVDEMAEMDGRRIIAEQSSVLVSRPHELGGIAYSKQTNARLPARHIHPDTAFAGRALDRVKQQGRYSQSNADINTPLVVGAGGLTGIVAQDHTLRSTKDTQILEMVDYTREKPTRGSGMFRIRSAQLAADPTVLNLNNLDLHNHYDVSSENEYRPPQSRAKKPSPLDTFRHNITFDVDSSPDANINLPYMALGSREYVGRQARAVKENLTRSDHLGLAGSSIGGPRSSRPRGAALRELEKMDERRANALKSAQQDRLAGVFSKVLSPLSAPPSEGQAERAQRPTGQQSTFRDARRAARR